MPPPSGIGAFTIFIDRAGDLVGRDLTPDRDDQHAAFVAIWDEVPEGPEEDTVRCFEQLHLASIGPDPELAPDPCGDDDPARTVDPRLDGDSSRRVTELSAWYSCVV